jgi:hypothetical protein
MPESVGAPEVDIHIVSEDLRNTNCCRHFSGFVRGGPPMAYLRNDRLDYAAGRAGDQVGAVHQVDHSG